MAQKIVWLPEVGEVVLAKRKGAKNLRLSVSPSGKIRVGMPPWVPYATGVSFVKSRSEWVNQRLKDHRPVVLDDKRRIGKSYRLNYIHNPKATRTRSRINGQQLNVISSQSFDSSSVQEAAIKISERALKQEAGNLLPPRLAHLASKYGFRYKGILIKKMVSRWGSCSNQKVITLNYLLMQLPWEMIDYVLLHELVHTKHLNHSREFWIEFESVYPEAKQTRQHIKKFRPVINSVA